MDEAAVFLINLHQLLVCLIPHGGLWVRSHGNQVGHTLKKKMDHQQLQNC